MAEPCLHGAPPAGGQPRWLTTPDGLRLRFVFWPVERARGVVILMQGRAEFIEKYYETVSRLKMLGFSVATFDWRGQGLSTRILDRPRRGYIKDFGHFQTDIDTVLAATEVTQHPGRRVMLAHSMGGCIGFSRLYTPATFDAAILSAPMLGLALPRPVSRLAPALAAVLDRLGLGQRYASGCDDCDVAQRGYDDNVLTTDRTRFDRFVDVLEAHPETALGGVTWGWINAAFHAMRIHAKSPPEAVKVPTLILRADDDRVVSNDAIDTITARNSAVTTVPLPGSQHEPLQETDAIQGRVWSAIGDFLA